MKWEKWEKTEVWLLATDNGFVIFFFLMEWCIHGYAGWFFIFIFKYLNNATNSNSQLLEVMTRIIGNWLLVQKNKNKIRICVVPKFKKYRWKVIVIVFVGAMAQISVLGLKPYLVI